MGDPFERPPLEAESVGLLPPTLVSFYGLLGIKDPDEIRRRYEEKFNSSLVNIHQRLLGDEQRADRPEVDYGERIIRSAIDISGKLKRIPTPEEFAASNPHAMIRTRFEREDMEEAILALRKIDDDQEIWVFAGMSREAAERAASEGIRMNDKTVQGVSGGAPGRGESGGLYVAAHPTQAGWYALQTYHTTRESGVIAIKIKKGNLRLPPEATTPGRSVDRFATEEGESIDIAEALVNAKYGAVIEGDIPAESIIYVAPRRKSESERRPGDIERETWHTDGYSAITQPSTGDRRTYFLLGGYLRYNENP